MRILAACWAARDPGSLRILPVQLPGLSGVTQVANGGQHALAVDRSGLVWAWGWDDHGQLGDGAVTTAIEAALEPVPGLSGIAAVAATESTSFALRSDGVLFAWGQIPVGLLGGGPSGDISRPVRVPGPAGVTQVAVYGGRTADVVAPRLVTYLTPVSQVALGAGGNGLAIASASSSYVTVPDVRGDDLATATAAIERARLRVGTVTYVGVCRKPGYVIDQAPEAVASGIVTMRPVLSGISLTVGRLMDFCLPS